VAEPLTEPPPVSVAGLLIPADLAPKIIEALRFLYPTITDGKEDDPAVRAVLIHFITSAMETYQIRKANEALDLTVEGLQAQAAQKQAALRAQIRAAASRIKEKPDDPVPTG